MSSSSIHTLKTWRYAPSTDSFELKAVDRALGPREVLVKTTHSGLCYTDVHAKTKGCGLGHEGVGHIVAIGSEVTAHRVRTRVGWGWLHHSCGNCRTCVTGYHQYCAQARGFAYGELDQGAFGDYAIWDETFVYAIPDNIPSAAAGPLMCAGASVYEALVVAGTKPSDHVGVVGIGGLGHLAVLFAKAMGCGVTALSSHEGKKMDASRLGADVFRNASSPDQSWETPSMSVPGCREAGINTLLICTNEVPPLEPLLPLLAPQATIIPMTIQTTPISIPFLPFILPGHRIVASTEASKQNHIDMLQFASRHRIMPAIEEFPMNNVGLREAFRKLEAGNMRYRGVLVQKGSSKT
ncbi:Uu.00g068930.m01.CDS01 [Anthostomella pinea]|uniref:Uu.00g068930.m01.CDS01 n=1 Tax=Anthostomella pinea TaxID=933095 RepID=A0AAI8YNH5_9PEZI|nr:Uu.00g068930.m01.CDS01 [Anthostomella pinea]